ncbi:Uncharacterised protein [Mycoplasmopsis gallopavonis]|uniref:Uncharacterized protein n=1 Tax=Mycoplasmopsis gallopavonis TaxID=76629 RepID=A0A449AZJ0_9BACT|nr:hypothetical protein [Mycoplasmopsis gallopavonis]VEU72895.1 Uncharacterised protein [Mycoplasmopsis gallopavonis]
MKFKKKLSSLLTIFAIGGVIAAPSAIVVGTKFKKEANAWFGKIKKYHVKQSGIKLVQNKVYSVSYDGEVWTKSYFWSSDQVFWKGQASTFKGSSNHPLKIILSIDTWVEGSGKPSISFSAGASSGNGLEASVGISSSPTEKGRIFHYPFQNTSKGDVYYSYSGHIWSAYKVDMSSNATYKERDKYVIVDSLADENYSDRR